MPWNEPMLNGDIILIILLFGWNIIVIILYIYIIRFMGICSHHWYMSVSTILNMWHKYEVQLRRLVDKRRGDGWMHAQYISFFYDFTNAVAIF